MDAPVQLAASLESTSVCIKQFRYLMNGMHVGDLFLHRDGTTQWWNKISSTNTRWHGEWYRTHDRRGLKVHFDFKGIEDTRKWVWLKKDEQHNIFDGIDYQQRWITMTFLRNFSTPNNGQSFDVMPTNIDDIDDSEAWEVALPPNAV